MNAPVPEPAPHEISEILIRIAQDGPGDTVVFTDEGLAFVKEALDLLLEAGPELMDAVETLLVAAHLIEIEKNSVLAAQQLVALVEAPEVLEGLKRLNEEKDKERADAVHDSAKEFNKFTSSEEQNRAPEADEEKPEGTVSVMNFDFPKRL